MTRERPTNWKTTLLVTAVLAVVASAAVVVIYSTEPEATRGGARRVTEMLVDVIPVERGSHRPRIVATGTVRAARDVVLSPRVAGTVVWRALELEPGAIVAAGETLLRIDDADYRNALAQRRSDLQQALSALDLEQGRRSVAQSELEIFTGDVPDASRARALREPQLQASEAQVEAARAAVRQAELDIQRTRVKAPFAGQILDRLVDEGSQVAVGQPLARLVGIDAYWVEVTVPRSKLGWLTVASGEGEPRTEVRIRSAGAWPNGVYRTGYVERLIGALDDRTRMARILATLPDPLGRNAANTDPGAEPSAEPSAAPPLMIGDYVETTILGDELEDVVRLPRDLVRDGETVWLMVAGKLVIRDVEVLATDLEHVYIAAGLSAGDLVVTTDLARVVEGSPLRRRPAPGGRQESERQPSEHDAGERQGTGAP